MKKRILSFILAFALAFSLCIPASADSGTIKVEIPGTGKTINLAVELNETIESIKASIQDKEGISPDQQSLFFDDQELEDLYILTDYGIKDNDTLQLILGLREQWSKLQSALAAETPATVAGVFEVSGSTIRLLTDIKAGSDDTTLTVGGTKILDLNGHALNANGSDMSVITVPTGANLTIQDSSTGSQTHSFTVGDDGLWTLDETNGTKTVTGGVITGGRTSGTGGGVYNSGTVIMTGGTIAGNASNASNNCGGGGVYNAGGSAFTLSGGTITGNFASQNGGGVLLQENGAFTMTGGSITGNSAGKNGGGVYANGTIELSGGDITSNSAVQNGGGVDVNGKLIMTGGTIADNSTDSGGGVFVNATCVFEMQGGAISGNSASSRGGGVYVNSSGEFTMTAGSICDNASRGAGGIYNSSIAVTKLLAANDKTIEITGNEAEKWEGGIANWGEMHLSGKVLIGNNTCDAAGYPVNLATKSPIVIDGALTGSEICITHAISSTDEHDAGVLTSGFTAQNAGAKLGDFFTYDGPNSFAMKLNGSGELEAAIVCVITNNAPAADENANHGSLAVAEKAIAGETVTLTVTPGSGYQLKADSLKAAYNDGTEKDLDLTQDTTDTAKYTFTMPAYPVTVTAAFEHTHSFTCTANGGVLSAACVTACPDGYGTPLTLTLTAPTDLVYNGSAKTVTFASGEEAAWTGAGLTLPAITYTVRNGAALDGAPIDAGAYIASITVDTDKTAGIEFTIAKATPYIKTAPAPTDITYGQMLADSTLVGGYAQVSGTITTQVGGLFEWTDGTIAPAVSDGGTTEYEVTFTPSDEYAKNFNTAACKITLTVNKGNTDAPALADAAAIDYVKETIAAKEGYEISTGSGADFDANRLIGETLIDFTETYYLRKAASENSNLSGETEYTPVRPAVPGGVTARQETIVKKDDAVLRGVTEELEYWTEADGVNIGGWRPGWDGGSIGLVFDSQPPVSRYDVKVRVKATDSAFASEEATFVFTPNTTDKLTATLGDTTQQVAYGEKLNKPADPEKEGYTFGGWYVDDTFTTAWDFETDIVTEDVTLFAMWTEVPASEPEIKVEGIGEDAVEGMDDLMDSLGADTTEVRLTVTMQDGTETDAPIIEKELSADQQARYLDITIVKTTGSGSVYVTEPDVTLAFTLVSDFTGVKLDSVKVLRVHRGSVDTLTTAQNEDGEYIELHASAGNIILHVCKFSTYAIVYELEGADPGPLLPAAYPVVAPAATENGRLTISRKEAYANEKVTLTAAPDEGCELDSITVTDRNGNEIVLTDLGNGKFSFVMPESTVTVAVSFRAAEAEAPVSTPCLKDETCPLNRFIDTDANAWYHDGIEYCLINGLMKGVSDSEFNPNGTISRTMIAMMLWRLEGEPVVENELSFSDAAEGKWYTEAIRWAAAEGIVTGYDDGTCKPEKDVTREELATILYRYAQKKGEGFTGESMFLMPFDDLNEISGWANEAVRWCYMKGIILGRTETTFVPGDTATRAEAAAMMQRFCESLEK